MEWHAKTRTEDDNTLVMITLRSIYAQIDSKNWAFIVFSVLEDSLKLKS